MGRVWARCKAVLTGLIRIDRKRSDLPAWYLGVRPKWFATGVATKGDWVNPSHLWVIVQVANH